MTIHILRGDLMSMIDFSGTAQDFDPANPIELRGVYSSVSSRFDCALLCHQDPQCRTLVFDAPFCRLYEGSHDTGSIVPSVSTNSIVGAINYDNIHLASAYNQSCDHCYPDRYLICRNNTCQCPSNTFWDGQNKCLNQVYVGSSLSCNSDDSCRQDLNLTCQYNKCQCPVKMFWNNQKCVPQLLNSAPCNTSDQCRNDLNLICSRTNKTCISTALMKIPVINGTVPVKFANLSILTNWSGYEWWRAFDGNLYSYWNSAIGYALDYLLITFDDEYLLNSIQLSIYGDASHDPKRIDIYLDENATCLAESFFFPPVNNQSFPTFPPSPFNVTAKPVVAKQVLLAIDRWSVYQVWLFELAVFGFPY